MSEQFLGEIKIVGFAHAPKTWALCNGQLLPINQNQALFALLGTTFGGNGQTNFALPDMRGRVPLHVGGFNSGSQILGERGGQEAHTVTISELPQHTHTLVGSGDDGNGVVPATRLLAATNNLLYRNTQSDLTAMAPSSVTSVGGSQPHINLQPYLVVNFVIALIGIFPTQN